jgi:hypothetical protein
MPFVARIHAAAVNEKTFACTKASEGQLGVKGVSRLGIYSASI